MPHAAPRLSFAQCRHGRQRTRFRLTATFLLPRDEAADIDYEFRAYAPRRRAAILPRRRL